MPNKSAVSLAAFNIGEIVRHKHYDFRGIIFDVDFEFSLDEKWYQYACENLAKMGLPALEKNQPFYHILTHNSDHESYVSQQNLELAEADCTVSHQSIDKWFMISQSGAYKPRISIN